MTDDYPDAPIAPDTDAAAWEARHCIQRKSLDALNEQTTRHLRALAVAQKALAYYAGTDANGPAMKAMETIRGLVNPAAHKPKAK